ncbi:unnamed protein product, partial [Amoebophrya sp. A120]
APGPFPNQSIQAGGPPVCPPAYRRAHPARADAARAPIPTGRAGPGWPSVDKSVAGQFRAGSPPTPVPRRAGAGRPAGEPTAHAVRHVSLLAAVFLFSGAPRSCPCTCSGDWLQCALRRAFVRLICHT